MKHARTLRHLLHTSQSAHFLNVVAALSKHASQLDQLPLAGQVCG